MEVSSIQRCPYREVHYSIIDCVCVCVCVCVRVCVCVCVELAIISPPIPPSSSLSQNGTATIEEFHQEIQTVTNHPLRQFIIPFLKVYIIYSFNYIQYLRTCVYERFHCIYIYILYVIFIAHLDGITCFNVRTRMT